MKEGKDIYLTEGENNLLNKLILKKNEIVLREELADSDFDENELRKVDVQITRLRQKIEKNPKQPHFIKTIRGKGYKLISNQNDLQKIYPYISPRKIINNCICANSDNCFINFISILSDILEYNFKKTSPICCC